MRKQKPTPIPSAIVPEDPALTPEARENQLIAAAERLAEKQLLEGTASSQVIVHYLRLGTSRERLEKEKIHYETEMLKAKKESLESAKRTEDLFAKAIEAFRAYQGNDESDYPIL